MSKFKKMSAEEVRQALRTASEIVAWLSFAVQASGQPKDEERSPLLRDIETCILEAAPPSTERGFSMPELADAAGYKCNGRFRAIVKELAARGLLEFNYRFIRKAKG